MIGELVTVVVPVYNVEKYLERCINSLVNQTYTPLEIILVNDGSTDNSPAMCDYFAQKYPSIHVVHQENGGLSAARNTGTEKATGKYICYVDSDDYCDLDMVEYLIYIKDKYQADMSLAGCKYIFENRKMVKSLVMGNGQEEVLNPHDCMRNMLYHKNIEISAWSKLYKAELMKKTPYPIGKKCEDVGTTYKTFMACQRIACGYRPKYNYCLRSDSITTGAFSEKDFDMLEMADGMCHDVLSVYPDLEKATIRYRVYTRFVLYNRMLKSPDYEQQKEDVISFINSYRKDILLDSDAPIRDRLAMLLFTLNRKLYEKVWRFSKR